MTDDILERLSSLRTNLEVRFSGQFVEFAICAIDGARSKIEAQQARIATLEATIHQLGENAAQAAREYAERVGELEAECRCLQQRIEAQASNIQYYQNVERRLQNDLQAHKDALAQAEPKL